MSAQAKLQMVNAIVARDDLNDEMSGLKIKYDDLTEQAAQVNAELTKTREYLKQLESEWIRVNAKAEVIADFLIEADEKINPPPTINLNPETKEVA